MIRKTASSIETGPNAVNRPAAKSATAGIYPVLSTRKNGRRFTEFAVEASNDDGRLSAPVLPWLKGQNRRTEESE